MLVAYKRSSMRFQTGNSTSPHLSNEVCDNLHRKPVEPWREVLVSTNTEENSRAKVNPDETTAPPLSFWLLLEPCLQFSLYTWPLFPQIQKSLISGSFPSTLQNSSQSWWITYEREVIFSNWGLLQFDCWLRRRPRIRRLVHWGWVRSNKVLTWQSKLGLEHRVEDWTFPTSKILSLWSPGVAWSQLAE